MRDALNELPNVASEGLSAAPASRARLTKEGDQRWLRVLDILLRARERGLHHLSSIGSSRV